MALFGVRTGLRIFGLNDIEADVLYGAVTPSVSGLAAPEGSLYLKTDGFSYKKTGPADVDWQSYGEIEGGGLLWSTISGATDAEASQGYVLDSSGGAFTVTMPAAPAVGDTVGFAGLGDISTNNVTVDLNGLNMNGSTDDLVIDLDYCYFEMLYTGDAVTGWVLSNTDESGNVDNIQTFIGSSDNVDPSLPEYTEENYIDDGDPLEDAIDKLDIALNDTDTTASGLEVRVSTNEGDILTNAGNISTNAGNISTNAGDIITNASGIAANDVDITALESYTGSAGASLPDYNQEYYISDGDPLEEAVSKLDDALKTVADTAATGVSWREAVTATTGEVVTTGVGDYTTGDYFADDDAPLWLYEDWADGSEVLSINTTTSGYIYTWNDGADQWVHTDTLAASQACSCRYDFPDTPGSQEDGAAYMMKADESEVIKIADFDWEDASTIGLSSGYTASSGTVTSSDTVESALEKLDGNITNVSVDLSTLDGRVTTNEGDIITNAGGISTNAGDIITNASGIADNATDIGDLEAAVGSSTGLAGMDYTSNNFVIDSTSAVDAISALDAGLYATVSGIARIDTNVDNLNTAHNNLAAAVLIEATTAVNALSTDTVVDTVTQAGTLGAKWFVVVYDGSGNRYACEIYAMHDGTTGADLTEYAILTVGTKLRVDFDIVANGTNMTLTVDNRESFAVTVKTQRITVQTATVDTTAVITS